MAVAKMWDGTKWVDVYGLPVNGMTTDTNQTVTGLKDFSTANVPTIGGKGLAKGGTAAGLLIQQGSFTVSLSSGIATGTLTFPVAYSAAPSVAILCQAITNNTSLTFNHTGITATQCGWRAQQQATGTTYTGSVTAVWIAAGLP